MDGYELASWESGYGDFVLAPDLATPPGDQLAAGHRAGDSGRRKRSTAARCASSPRQILRAQLARSTARGWTALACTELEFIVFEGGYEQAWDARRPRLDPANRYNAD